MLIKAKGFTLIELLIVVAIIAVLAAIAVPNFLEAQVRSKTSRVKNDLRSMATALESYCVDHNHYTRDSDSDLDRDVTPPLVWNVNTANGAIQLTTPIAYLTSLMSDPFAQGSKPVSLPGGGSGGVSTGYRIGSGDWSYLSASDGGADSQDAFSVAQTNGLRKCWVVLSPGPDRGRNRMGYKCFPFKSTSSSETGFYQDYDSTNGTISNGDIYRFGGEFLAGNWDRNAAGKGPHGPEQL